MIQCPNCAKDIADDSAHCGFCGAKIETGAGKKTMMGFAALTGDRLKEAAEEAKRAREAAEQNAPASTQSAEQKAPASTPAPARRDSQLPQRPGKTRPTDDGRPKLPSVPRPTPQAGTPATVPSQPQGNVSFGDDGGSTPDDNSPTAVMSAVPGNAPSTVDEEAVTDGPDFAADTNPNPPTAGGAPKTVPVTPPAEETIPERDGLGPSGPMEFGGGHVVDGPSEFGSGSNIVISENTLPEKKKNPVMFIVGAIAFLMFLCCAFWLAYSLLLPILMAL